MNDPKAKRKFRLHDFNIFVTALAVLMLFVFPPSVVAIRYVFLEWFSYPLPESISMFLAFLLVVSGLIWFWESLDLSPLPIVGRESDWKWGHKCVAIGNILVVVPIVLVGLVVMVSGNENNALYLWWAMPGWLLAIILWWVGGKRIGKSSRWEILRK